MNITISEEELHLIVGRAVKAALAEIAQRHESPAPDSEQDSKKSETFSNFGEQELDNAMRFMASNRGKSGEPMVGIFWYDRTHNDLFGIRSHLASDYTKANSRSEFGSISCSEMHEDVWKKEFHRQKYKLGGIGPFNGPYEMTPRGRVFYNPETDEFTIAVGHWIEQYPQAVALVEEEFNLVGTVHTVKVASHWDIGQKWQ